MTGLVHLYKNIMFVVSYSLGTRLPQPRIQPIRFMPLKFHGLQIAVYSQFHFTSLQTCNACASVWGMFSVLWP